MLYGRAFCRRAADLTAARHWNPHSPRGFRTSILSSATSTIAVPEMGRGLLSSTFQLSVSTFGGLHASTFWFDVSTFSGLCREV